MPAKKATPPAAKEANAVKTVSARRASTPQSWRLLAILGAKKLAPPLAAKKGSKMPVAKIATTVKKGSGKKSAPKKATPAKRSAEKTTV